MNLREIKGFPDYVFDAETRNIVNVRKWQPLKIRCQYPSLLTVQMTQDGKRRKLTFNRLLYAIENGISYDDIPKDLYIQRDRRGKFKVLDKQGMIEIANSSVRKERRRNRIKRIDEKIHELEIMRRAYTDGSHIEAVRYIESRKSLLVNHHIKKYGTSYSNAEKTYVLALERMIERIDCDTSQVTELTVSMMGLMRKVRTRLLAEVPYHE
ncbi:MAG: hypothetical protein IKM68_10275 [Bacteroidaceae bacterium]|nr:hypothetical protein [Bacteroidaceae bacterium]MBR6139340.1 hypothetical protein [Prevotella sp.]